MDGRGGCCIARYASGTSYDMSKMDRIMLRFRPIAPKPVLNGKDSVTSTAESSDVYVKTGRGKRRYARNNSNTTTDSNSGSRTKKSNTGRKRKSPSSSSTEDNDKTVVSGGSFSRGDPVALTLPLLPETPEEKNGSPVIKGSSISGGTGGVDRKVDRKNSLPMWLSFGKEDKVKQVTSHARSVYMPVRSVVSTWVRVECITEAWVDLCSLGRTDEEKLINLEKDTCPGFLSDGFNRVHWTNKAYRDITAVEGGDVVVWLVIKEGTELPVRSPAFTCSVRLVTSGKEKNSPTLPCDVWRLDCGGFAWRLDTKAALSLGR